MAKKKIKQTVNYLSWVNQSLKWSNLWWDTGKGGLKILQQQLTIL